MNNDTIRLLKIADALAKAAKVNVERLHLRLIHYEDQTSAYHCDLWLSDGRRAYIYENGTVEWYTWKE